MLEVMFKMLYRKIAKENNKILEYNQLNLIILKFIEPIKNFESSVIRLQQSKWLCKIDNSVR